MLKKYNVIIALLLATLCLLAGCNRGSALKPGATSIEDREDEWKNPEFNMDEVVDIPDVFQLDLTNLAPISWSDNDKFSVNPASEVAEVSVNPNGGYDFTFTKFNQRIVFILDSSQRFKLWEASSVDIVIDGEATEHTNQFRYHIGWSELGASWNASNSPEPGSFDSILRATIDITVSEPEERQEKIVNFMIQSRGGELGKAFDPVTVTIRSITFHVHYD